MTTGTLMNDANNRIAIENQKEKMTPAFLKFPGVIKLRS